MLDTPPKILGGKTVDCQCQKYSNRWIECWFVLSEKVVDGHDGDVVFDSVEVKGSTFEFRLPIML